MLLVQAYHGYCFVEVVCDMEKYRHSRKWIKLCILNRTNKCFRHMIKVIIDVLACIPCYPLISNYIMNA